MSAADLSEMSDAKIKAMLFAPLIGSSIGTIGGGIASVLEGIKADTAVKTKKKIDRLREQAKKQSKIT